jgi:hypothetical protein
MHNRYGDLVGTKIASDTLEIIASAGSLNSLLILPFGRLVKQSIGG